MYQELSRFCDSFPGHCNQRLGSIGLASCAEVPTNT